MSPCCGIAETATDHLEESTAMKTIAKLAALALLPFAAFQTQANNAAEVATDRFCQCGTCGAALGTSALQTFDARAVATSSGNVTFQCHFDVPEGFSPAKALHPESSGCLTPFGAANKVNITISPGGKAKLTCQVSPSAD
jgi:hypothetical protein